MIILVFASFRFSFKKLAKLTILIDILPITENTTSKNNNGMKYAVVSNYSYLIVKI